MKMKILIILVCPAVLISCARQEVPSKVESQKQIREVNTTKNILIEPPKIDSNSAIKIARGDFVRIIGTKGMKDYQATVAQEKDGWRVRFQTKPELVSGGGGVYLVDKDTGKIISRDFYQ